MNLLIFYKLLKKLYTTLLQDKLKTRLKEIIHKAFSHRNYGSKFVVLGYNSTYYEQVDDPAMYLSLYGVLWSLGIHTTHIDVKRES
jgi:hypothetical protein